MLESDGSEKVSSYLVAQNTQPDSHDSHAEGVAEEVGDSSADNGYANHGSDGCVEGISGAAQASHVDNLTNLEDYNEDDHAHNLYADFDNMLLAEEQTEQAACAEIVNYYQQCGNGEANHPAGASVFLGEGFIFFAQASAD